MEDEKIIDVSHIQLSSFVFPTDEDMTTWNSLNVAEQHAVIQRELDAGKASGIAPSESIEEILQRVRGAPTHGL